MESSPLGTSSYIISDTSSLESFALSASSFNQFSVSLLPFANLSTNFSQSSPPIAASILICSVRGRPLIWFASSSLFSIKDRIKSSIFAFVLESSSSNITWNLDRDSCACSTFFAISSFVSPFNHCNHCGVSAPIISNRLSLTRPVAEVALFVITPYLSAKPSFAFFASSIFSLSMSYCFDRLPALSTCCLIESV